MHRFLLSQVCVLALFVSSSHAGKSQRPAVRGSDPGGSVTLPLEQLLGLHQDKRDAEAATVEARKEKAPPVAAAIDFIQLEGRLLDDAVDIEAKFRVTVLADGEWVTIPLLDRDPRMSISVMPKIEGAALVSHENTLSLITNRRGVFEFGVSFIMKASREGDRRKVEIGYHDATLAVLELAFDENLFRFAGVNSRRTAEGATVYPEGASFVLAWQQVSGVARKKTEERQRPAIESTIPHAFASVVSTLEGRRIARLLYELSFEGTKPLVLRIADGQTLEKVYLNGAAIAFELTGNELQLDVTTKRAGDETGTLELSLSSTQGSFFLSGDLDFDLPKSSWPIGELHATLHLPAVFNYQWSGGSLAPVMKSRDGAFTNRVPTPGKKLVYHQYLIAASTPNVELAYTIDLAGQYFH